MDLHLPQEHRRAFWSSDFTRTTLLTLDRWGIISSMVCHFSLSIFLDRRMTSTTSDVVKWVAWATVPVACYMLFKRPILHLRYRTSIIMAQRFYRIIGLTLTCIDKGYSEGLRYTLTRGHLTWRGYLYVIVFTSILPALNAINFPLPFHLQLPMVLLKLVIDLLVVVPRIHCALMLSAATATSIPAFSTASCDATIGLLESFGKLNQPYPIISPQDSLCNRPDSGLAFVLLIQVLLGAVLPLSVTYWFEGSMKRCWLAYCTMHAHAQTSSARLPGCLSGWQSAAW